MPHAGVWPTPEQELLLQAALWPGDEAVAAWSEWSSRVDLIKDHLDEGSFRLLPVVYRNLERHRLGGPLMSRLKGIYRYSWAKNIALFGEAQRVLHKLSAAGIETIILKGVALSLLYYRDRGARPMSDIDILVPTRDAEASLKCLALEGWRKFDMREDGDLRYRWAATLVDGTEHQLDLHWHALHECVYPEADDDFWKAAVRFEMPGFTTKALSPADNLLHVIIHGIYYNIVSPVRWAADAAMIIRFSGNEMPWERLLQQARKRKLLLRLGTGLGYLHDRLKVPIPAEVLRKCRDWRPSIFEQSEYSLVGKPPDEVNDSLLGGWPLVILTYRRITLGQRIWPRVWGFADYMRYRLFAARRRDIVPTLLRRVPGKIRKILARPNRKSTVGDATMVVSQPKNKDTEHDRKKLLDLAAWRYFGNYYRDKFRSLFLFAVVAAAQAILVLPVLLLVRRIFDVALPTKHISQIVLIGAGIFFLRTLNGAIALWVRSKQIKTFKSAISQMREDLLARLYIFSRRFYTQLDRNTTHARIVQDTERLDDVSNALMSRLLPALLSSFALIIVLLFLNWFLLLIMVSLTPLLLLTVRLTGRRVKERVFVFQRAFETFSKGTMFVLHHMDLVHIQSCETEDARVRAKEVQHLRRTGERMAFIYAVHGQLQNSVTSLSGIIILTLGAVSVAAHSMTLGQLLSFWVAAGLLNGYVRTIIETVPQILAGNESMVTLYRLMHEGESPPYSGQRRIGFTGEIELRDVDFAFEQRPVLNGLTLRIHPGANLAIIGPNGAGKSTLAWLILGAYRPRKGVLLADGVPYDEIDMVDFRRSIGTVTQHPEFFTGSIAENIGYGTNHTDLDEMKRAARIALVHEFIESLPEGYDTQVGEGGVLLAGGEAQRLAIARALLRKPRLLILDEPTNHLDRSAIRRLMQELQTLEHRPAILTISHDREVVDFADEVYALKDGVAVPQSTSAMTAETTT